MNLQLGDDDDELDDDAGPQTDPSWPGTALDPLASTRSKGGQAGSSSTAAGTKGSAKEAGGPMSASARLREQLAAKDREVEEAMQLSR